MMPKEEAEPRIRFLMKHQYHVFTQSNDVFSGISVENAEFIAKKYPKFASVRNQLFRESLNNSRLNFENSFYRVRVQTAVEWINLAREAGRHDVIKKIVRYVSFLYDESTGESVLFHAIKHLDLETISFIFRRRDWIDIVLFRDTDMNAFDLAIEQQRTGNDPNFQTFQCLLDSISPASLYRNIDRVKNLYDGLIKCCTNNEGLLNLVKQHLEKIIQTISVYNQAYFCEIFSEYIDTIENQISK